MCSKVHANLIFGGMFRLLTVICVLCSFHVFAATGSPVISISIGGAPYDLANIRDLSNGGEINAATVTGVANGSGNLNFGSTFSDAYTSNGRIFDVDNFTVNQNILSIGVINNQGSGAIKSLSSFDITNLSIGNSSTGLAIYSNADYQDINVNVGDKFSTGGGQLILDHEGVNSEISLEMNDIYFNTSSASSLISYTAGLGNEATYTQSGGSTIHIGCTNDNCVSGKFAYNAGKASTAYINFDSSVLSSLYIDNDNGGVSVDINFEDLVPSITNDTRVLTLFSGFDRLYLDNELTDTNVNRVLDSINVLSNATYLDFEARLIKDGVVNSIALYAMKYNYMLVDGGTSSESKTYSGDTVTSAINAETIGTYIDSSSSATNVTINFDSNLSDGSLGYVLNTQNTDLTGGSLTFYVNSGSSPLLDSTLNFGNITINDSANILTVHANAMHQRVNVTADDLYFNTSSPSNLIRLMAHDQLFNYTQKNDSTIHIGCTDNTCTTGQFVYDANKASDAYIDIIAGSTSSFAIGTGVSVDINFASTLTNVTSLYNTKILTLFDNFSVVSTEGGMFTYVSGTNGNNSTNGNVVLTQQELDITSNITSLDFEARLLDNNGLYSLAIFGLNPNYILVDGQDKIRMEDTVSDSDVLTSDTIVTHGSGNLTINAPGLTTNSLTVGSTVPISNYENDQFRLVVDGTNTSSDINLGNVTINPYSALYVNNINANNDVNVKIGNLSFNGLADVDDDNYYNGVVLQSNGYNLKYTQDNNSTITLNDFYYDANHVAISYISSEAESNQQNSYDAVIGNNVTVDVNFAQGDNNQPVNGGQAGEVARIISGPFSSLTIAGDVFSATDTSNYIVNTMNLTTNNSSANMILKLVNQDQTQSLGVYNVGNHYLIKDGTMPFAFSSTKTSDYYVGNISAQTLATNGVDGYINMSKYANNFTTDSLNVSGGDSLTIGFNGSSTKTANLGDVNIGGLNADLTVYSTASGGAQTVRAEVNNLTFNEVPDDQALLRLQATQNTNSSTIYYDQLENSKITLNNFAYDVDRAENAFISTGTVDTNHGNLQNYVVTLYQGVNVDVRFADPAQAIASGTKIATLFSGSVPNNQPDSISLTVAGQTFTTASLSQTINSINLTTNSTKVDLQLKFISTQGTTSNTIALALYAIEKAGNGNNNGGSDNNGGGSTPVTPKHDFANKVLGAASLANISPTSPIALFNTAFQGLNETQQIAAEKQLRPETNNKTTVGSTQVTSESISVTENRMFDVVNGVNIDSANKANFANYIQSFGASQSGTLDASLRNKNGYFALMDVLNNLKFDFESYKVATWGRLTGKNYNQGSRLGADGFNGNMYGITLGADIQAKNDTLIGVALSSIKNKVTAEDDDRTDIDSTQFILYGSMYNLSDKLFNKLGDGYYVSGLASVTKHHYNGQRGVTVGSQSATAYSNYGGMEYGAKVNVGKNINVTYGAEHAKTFLFVPSVGLYYSRLGVDSYSETGSIGNAGLNLTSTKYNTLIGSVSTTASKNLEVGGNNILRTLFSNKFVKAQTFTPYVSVEYMRNFITSGYATVAQFIAGGDSFDQTGVRRQRNLGSLSAGVTLGFFNKSSVSAHYTFQAANRFVSHTASVQLRINL